MQVVLGLDIGTSATKIVAIDEDRTILEMHRLVIPDPIAACRTAVDRITSRGAFGPGDVLKIMLTGVGSSFIENDLLGIPTCHVTEFESQGRGGLFLGGMTQGVVCTMGTGTTLVAAGPEGFTHMGGSAVGGGTLAGLSTRLFGVSDPAEIDALAAQGDLHRVDWFMGEINREAIATLPDFATASNLGKMAPDASDADVALGLYNMIYQTAGVMAAIVCRSCGAPAVIVTGAMAQTSHAGELLGRVGTLYGIPFIIAKHPVYATAVGAALAGFESKTQNNLHR